MTSEAERCCCTNAASGSWVDGKAIQVPYGPASTEHLGTDAHLNPYLTDAAA
jgi:hypothetical protein